MDRMQRGAAGAGRPGDPYSVGYPWISNRGQSPCTNQTLPSAAPTTNPIPSATQRRLLRIGRWGNVLAVRLPQALSKLLNVQLGDELELSVLASGQLLLTAVPRRSRLALCAQLRESLQQP